MIHKKVLAKFLPSHKIVFARFHGWFQYGSVIDSLKNVYKKKLLPLEEHHLFHEFHSPKLNDCDFHAKPVILLMGQYSTGKTTLIKYLLKSDYPGMRIGPEPTTDKFIAVMHGGRHQTIPGNALVTDSSKPFTPLSIYGNAFLTRFQCALMPNKILENVTLIDTPGILSGEKQRVDRGYNFIGVLEWFAERVDRIILLFDAHKLDISDEFKWAIEALKRNSDKIMILLNKADMVDHQSLLRIYGSLMWSLDKVIATPEVPRVFVGSFWDQELKNNVNKQLFEDEERDFFKEIKQLPGDAVLRKVNDLNKRARLARVHALIMDSIRRNLNIFFNRKTQKEKIIENLAELFKMLQKESFPAGDFPDVKEMQEKLVHHDFSTFNKIKPNLMERVDEMLSDDIPKIILRMSQESVEDNKLKVTPYKTQTEISDDNPSIL